MLGDGTVSESESDDEARVSGAVPLPSAGGTQPQRVEPRRVRRWSRTGAAIPFRTGPDGLGGSVGWSWEIRRDGSEHRRIDVEVSPGPYLVTDLPAEARNAIRTRGATAVEAFLGENDPPVRIAVSTKGIEAHYARPDPAS